MHCNASFCSITAQAAVYKLMKIPNLKWTILDWLHSGQVRDTLHAVKGQKKNYKTNREPCLTPKGLRGRVGNYESLCSVMSQVGTGYSIDCSIIQYLEPVRHNSYKLANLLNELQMQQPSDSCIYHSMDILDVNR